MEFVTELVNQVILYRNINLKNGRKRSSGKKRKKKKKFFFFVIITGDFNILGQKCPECPDEGFT